MIPITLKFAWRETVGALTRFLFLFLCIALGVGAIVAVDLFATNVEQAILGDARALLGGDIELSWRRVMTSKGQKVMDSLEDRKFSVSHVTELSAMAALDLPDQPSNPSVTTTQLVELKAIDDAYPLYGTIGVEPEDPLRHLLAPISSGCRHLPCFGAIVQKSFLIRLQASIGSEIRIGQANFQITGVLNKEPDRIANAFSLGPRVFVSQKALQATQLVKTGSRIHERFRLKVPDTTPLFPLLGELRGRLSQEGVRVSSFRDAQPRLRRFLSQLNLYLGLIGLTILMVGGIGVACTIQGFVLQKTQIIATLKTLGADSGQIIRLYLTQSLILGGIGSLLGGAVGLILHQVLPQFLGGIIPETMTMEPTISPFIRGGALGIFSTLAFSLWPLLHIRLVSPALVFRQEVENHSGKDPNASKVLQLVQMTKLWWQDRPRMLTSLIIAGCLTGLAMWQAHSFMLGLFYTGAFVGAIGILLVGTMALYWTLGQISFPQRYLVRHAIQNLQRPGNFTKAMTLAIGIGVMLLTTLTTVQRSLLDFIGDQIPTEAPSFFFIDIQPDQQPIFQTILNERVPLSSFQVFPVMRARLTAINDQPIDPERYKGKRNGWYFTREYVSTARRDLPHHNTITDGEWWDKAVPASSHRSEKGADSPFRVSVEREAGKHLGLTLGSTLTFDVHGVPFVAQVASFRKVNWGSFSLNFFMIFEPGSFQEAPITYIASAKIPQSLEVPLQQAVVSALPNVSAINIRDVLNNITTLFRQLAQGIHALAILCLATGGLVMVAAISINRFRRLKELAILKSLGGSRGRLVFSLGVEFGLVGGFAGLIGLGLGNFLSWSVLHFFFDLPWHFDPLFFLIGLLTVIFLTLLTGVASTYRLLSLPPLSVLRQD